MSDLSIRLRWEAKLRARLALRAHAQKRVDFWRRKRDRAKNPSKARAHAREMLEQRRKELDHRRLQVNQARKVIRRHTTVMDWTALRVVAPWLTTSQAKTLAAALSPAFRKYGITTPKRAAAAVAQFCHESAGFRTTTEFASGAEYEGRKDLGNTHPGDGVRFRGRGYIQITGRSNYTAVTQAFGHNFLTDPAALATPKYAAMASCWWWDAHGCNQIADSGDFVALTRRINGGTNGLDARQLYHARAQKVASRLVP